MDNIVSIWSQALSIIKNDTLPVSYSTWIETIIPVDIQNNIIILQVPYEYNKTMIEERYSQLIKNTLMYITGNNFELDIRVKEDKKEEIPVENNKYKNSNNSNYYVLNPFYTFENFVTGDSNKVAYAFVNAASKACIEGSYCESNPIFIFGNAGLGKTHLMQAAGHKVLKETGNTKNVLYVTSEQFTNELTDAIKEKETQNFRNKYRKVDILMIDDIQFIRNMPGIQQEFHHTFNDLYQNDKIIIISSDRPPKELHGIEERLITRFESGMIQEIISPDYETRIAILKKKAEQLNIEMSEDIYHYIANVITTSNRELEGAMKMVVSLHRLMKRDISISLVQDALKSFNQPSEKIITADLIIETVEKYFNLSENSLKSSSKSKNIAYPRQIAMYLIKNMMDKKLKEIGDYFGGKDHSTVIHAIKKIEEDIKSDINIKSTVEDIEKDIKN